MNDKELADAVVALLPSIYRPGDYYRLFDVWHDDLVPGTMFSDIVRDWRVAGALMEKAAESGNQVLSWKDDGLFICDLPNVGDEILFDFARNDSLPRAIIEACVEALT